MPAPQTLPSRLIGALFVERGLVSESQIRVALEIQRETGQQLGQVLVERFGVSRKELASVVAEQWAKLGGSSGPEDTASWRRLGDIFVERGFVTQEELDEALLRQRQTGERLGEALVALGVISKFELAGALAEQMAVLGDPDAEPVAVNGQPEATVHQLHSRDAAEPETPLPPALNVIDFTPPAEWGAESVEPDQQATHADDEPVAEEPAAERSNVFDAISAYTVPVEESRPAEVMLTELHEALAPPELPAETEALETVEADAAPVEEAPAEVMLTELHEAVAPPESPAETESFESVEADAAPVEEAPAEVMLTELHEAVAPPESPAETASLESVEAEAVPVEEAQPAEEMLTELHEALAEAEPGAEAEPLQPMEAVAELVTPPQSDEVMLTELHETPFVETAFVDDAAPEVEPRTICVAFAPTTDGYRLVALEAQPEPGETIDIPEVGEYLVLRVGSSPIPGDDRRCAYVEELVTPPLVGTVTN